MSKKTKSADEGQLTEDLFAQLSMDSIARATELCTQELYDKATKELDTVVQNATGGDLTVTIPEGPDLPDDPSCDFCGKDFSGKFSCSQCSLAFYCSRECQRNHWKEGGHKDKCDDMKQLCHDAAEEFVGTLKDPNATLNQKLRTTMWSSVDEAGPYKIAVSLGLNEALLQMIKEDIVDAVQRFQSGCFNCYTQHMMCVLFRAGRCNPGFSHVDPYRVKKFVHSSPDAFEKWFHASMNFVNIFLTIGVEAKDNGDANYFWRAHNVARYIVGAWALVWTSTKASKAIILGTSGEADEAAHLRAKWTLKQCKNTLQKFWGKHIPDNDAVEGNMNTFVASYDIRLCQFGVDIGDFSQLLSLDGNRKAMYIDVAHTFAEAQIKKGRALSTTESNEALKEYGNQGNLRSRNASARAAKVPKVGNRKKGKGKRRK